MRMTTASHHWMWQYEKKEKQFSWIKVKSDEKISERNKNYSFDQYIELINELEKVTVIVEVDKSETLDDFNVSKSLDGFLCSVDLKFWFSYIFFLFLFVCCPNFLRCKGIHFFWKNFYCSFKFYSLKCIRIFILLSNLVTMSLLNGTITTRKTPLRKWTKKLYSLSVSINTVRYCILIVRSQMYTTKLNDSGSVATDMLTVGVTSE